MTTLEDLYYGNISPRERYIKRRTRVDKLVKLICKNEDELTAGLKEKQKETFEKFKDCTSELSCITEREAFSSGFILAVRIMVEVISYWNIRQNFCIQIRHICAYCVCNKPFSCFFSIEKERYKFWFYFCCCYSH